MLSRRIASTLPHRPFRRPSVTGRRALGRGLARVLAPAVLLAALMAGAVRVSAASLPVLILYDSAGPWGFLGREYALMLENLLGHFDVAVTSSPVNAYSTGTLLVNNYAVTFYVGSTYDEESFYAAGSPQRIHYDAFLADVATTTHRVVWMNDNLWKLAWNWNPAWDPRGFSGKFGISYVDLDSTSLYNRVSYKSTDLLKGVVPWANPGSDLIGCTAEAAPPGPYDCDTAMNVVAITDPALAVSRADAFSTLTGARSPYVTQAANLWVLGDIPFSYTSEEDRYLAVADLLHDILGIDHAESHQALVRLEDVSANTDIGSLMEAFDVLTAQGVPFAVALIPHYVDPFGFYSGGVPQDLPIAGSDVGALLAAVQSTGMADIAQEGTTHQFDDTLNPYTGVSGDDAEFFRVTQNADGSINFLGPVPGDSAAWASTRIAAGESLLNDAGLWSFAWFAPHYFASAVDYAAIQGVYPIHYGRLLYFDPASGSPPTRFFGQFYPYTIARDVYGYQVLPDNLNGLEPNPNPGFRPLFPNDLIRFATKALVVRDGFASFFYNSEDSSDYLDQTISGIEALGYTFVSGATVWPQ
jgi:uncharacterized protein YdaL